jgi:hypothetical protein
MIARRTLFFALVVGAALCSAAACDGFADSACPTPGDQGTTSLYVEDLGLPATYREISPVGDLEVFTSADAYADARGLGAISRATDGPWMLMRSRELHAESEGNEPARFLVGAIDIECNDVTIVDLIREDDDGARLRVATRPPNGFECGFGMTYPIVAATTAFFDAVRLEVYDVDPGCGNTLSSSAVQLDLSSWSAPRAIDCEEEFATCPGVPPCAEPCNEIQSSAYDDDGHAREAVACTEATVGTTDTACAVEGFGGALHFFSSGSSGREAACARDWLLCAPVQSALLFDLMGAGE